MSKIELPAVTGNNNTSRINDNFQKIEDALNQEVLYREGYAGEPNEMEANLDMNSNRILNLPDAVSLTEPVTLRQLVEVDSVNALALRNELSAPGGSSIVGFQQSGTRAAPRTAQDKMRELVSITDFGGDASGAVDNASAAAVMALDVGFIRLTRGSYLFGDVTIDCPIIFDFGAYIISNTGATVTITDSIESPRQWIFRGDGNYSLGHDGDGGENARQVHASWFGASPRPYSPSNPDQAPAFNKAMEAMGDGRESVIECDVGNYMMRSEVLMTRGAKVVGQGTRRTVFLHDSDGFVTFKTGNVACKLEGVQFEVYEPTLPSRTSPFVGIEHGECELYDVDVSNCKTAVYTIANNTRIKNVRGAYGQMQGVGTSVINVRGGSGHDIDGVYLGTSQFAPESAVLVGGNAQTSGIVGTRIQNISHIAPCASFKIEAKNRNIKKIEVDGFEYSGTTVTKPAYQAVISASGSSSVSGLIVDNGFIGENATNGILFENNSTGVISEVVLGDIIDSGTTGRGISFVENSGTLIGVSITDGVRVDSRSEPFFYSGQVDGVVISPNALPNTTPAYCYDFTIGDDSVATIALNKQVFTGFLFSSRGATDYSQLVIRAAPGPAVTRISGTASFAEVATPLTGTTGADGKVTIGITEGALYIENRLGSSQRFNIVLMTGQ